MTYDHAGGRQPRSSSCSTNPRSSWHLPSVVKLALLKSGESDDARTDQAISRICRGDFGRVRSIVGPDRRTLHQGPTARPRSCARPRTDRFGEPGAQPTPVPAAGRQGVVTGRARLAADRRVAKDLCPPRTPAEG